MSEDLKSEVPEEQTAMGYYIVEFISSPINIALLGVCAFLLYKVFKDATPPEPVPEPTILPMKRRDFTLEELREFDGRSGEGRILIAVNGKVFDMTRGKKYYGPGGPYEIFAGRDASRGLATMSLDESALKEGPDDLGDLTVSQLDIVKDWEMQFMDKYDHVGKLLKPGEEHTHYDEDEEQEKKTH